MSSTPPVAPERAAPEQTGEPLPRTTNPWLRRLGLIGLLGLAAGMRLAGITITGLWLDEGHTLWLSRLPVVEILQTCWAVDNHPPLAAVAWHYWGLISQNEVWLRLLAVIVGVATVWLAYAWGRRFSPMLGWWAGLLFAVHGILCNYSQEIRPYPWFYLLTMLCLWQVERWRQAPERWTHRIWLGVLFGLLVWSQAAGAVVCVAIAIYALLRGPSLRRSFGALVPSGIIAFVIALPSLWSVVDKAAFQSQDHWWVDFPPHFHLIRYYIENALGTRWMGYWVGTSVDPAVIWTGYAFERIILVLWGLLVACGLVAASVRRITAICLFTAACYLGWMCLLSAMAIPMILLRSVMPMMMLILLACAAGGAALMRYRRWAGVVVLLLWLGLHGGWWLWQVYNGPPQRVTPKAILQHFVGHFRPDKDLLLCCPATYELPLFYYIEDLVAPENYLPSDTTPLVWKDGHWQRTARHTDDKDYDWAEHLEAEILARRAAGHTGDLYWLRLGPDGIAPTGHTREFARRTINRLYGTPEHHVLWHEYLWRMHVWRYPPKEPPPEDRTTQPVPAPVTDEGA